MSEDINGGGVESVCEEASFKVRDAYFDVAVGTKCSRVFNRNTGIFVMEFTTMRSFHARKCGVEERLQLYPIGYTFPIFCSHGSRISLVGLPCGAL